MFRTPLAAALTLLALQPALAQTQVTDPWVRATVAQQKASCRWVPKASAPTKVLAWTASSAGSGGGATATASGMAAAALLGYTLKVGDHVLLPDDAYGGTFRFFARVLDASMGG